MEDAAIVWVESAFIEEETFLHCIPSAIVPDDKRAAIVSPASPHTSLKAIDGRRYFDSSREQVRESGEGHSEEDSKGSGRGEDGSLGVVPIDLPDRVHVGNGSRIIVVWSLCVHPPLTVNICPEILHWESVLTSAFAAPSFLGWLHLEILAKSKNFWSLVFCRTPPDTSASVATQWGRSRRRVRACLTRYVAVLILNCVTGTSGAASNYYTRSQAVRKLQISLGDFRRLCIFKGIYPREPRSKKRVSKSSTPSTTFYYAKDIQYLLHEPLLAKFRDQKALAKKISKALGRNEVSDAVRLERNLTPKLRLDHIIKERYPTFVDALRDLDDALSMLFLFANLPSTSEVPAKIIARCQRLTTEFEHYLIRTHCLRKSFLSIKGIYYQVTIQGQDILWLVPYKFVQRTGADVDYRIMATFVDFYTTLLGFVNFRLYTSIGLVYPPRFDAKAEEEGADLGAYQLEGRGEGVQAEIGGALDVESNERAQAEADQLLNLVAEEDSTQENERSEEDEIQEEADGENQFALDQFARIDDQADDLLQPSATADAATAGQLFEPYTFFLSRETPRHPLEFIVRAFGCKRVGWDTSLGDPGSYCSEDDTRITHQVVDRPDLPLPSPPATEDEAEPRENTDEDVVRKPNERVPGRIYVQPQWVWDSINAGQLQRPDLYAPGATLPPHLSPWVKPKRGDYDPTIPLAEQETEAELEIDDDEHDLEEDISIGAEHDNANGINKNETLLTREDGDEEDGGMDVELAESGEESSDAEPAVNGGDEWGGFSGDEGDGLESTDAAGRQAQAELEAEALGRQPPKGPPKEVTVREAAKVRRTQAEREAQADLDNRKMLMSRRKRKVYEKMAYSNSKKDEEAQKLRAKRRKIEKRAGDSS